MNEPAKKHRSTLVVGTTSDYIDWIRKVEPGKNIFLTDPLIRQKALEFSPCPQEEILCELTDYQLVADRIKEHMEYYLDFLALYEKCLASFFEHECPTAPPGGVRVLLDGLNDVTKSLSSIVSELPDK